MKLLAFIGLYVLGIQGLFAATVCTSTGDGNWDSSFSCVGSGTPRTYIIRAQDTITVNVTGTLAIDTVDVKGQLSFVNGCKIDMSSSGIILVRTGGTIVDGNGGSKFDFSSGSDVVGPFTVSGPAYATSGTGGIFLTGSLPVTWLDFNVSSVGNLVNIQWRTASEKNTKEYQLETGTDGSHWTTLKVLPAAGNSNVIKTYRYEHYINIQGMHYYRVKQTDIDGSFSYSDHRNVILSEGSQITYSPNPTRDIVHISASGHLVIRSVNLYTIKGEKIELPGGVLINDRVDISGLAPGMYLLQVQFENAEMRTMWVNKI